MKRTKVLMMAAAAMVLAAPYVQADSVVLKVDVPFEFVVADQVLPGGEYRFVQEQDTRVVRIYSKDNEQLTMTHWVPADKGAKGSGKLVFHKYGSQRFLKMIRAGNGRGAYLPKTRSEREARSGGDAPKVARAQ